MGDRHEFDVERSDRHAPARGHDLDRDLGRSRLAEPARLRKTGGEGRSVDPGSEARPKVGERADVVLVRVGDDDADEVLPQPLDEADVGQDEIDPGQVVAGERDAEIDHQPLARARRPVAVERAIHADLAEASERREHQLAVIDHPGLLPARANRARRPRRRRVAARR